jgi:hypothetical protein
MRKTSNAFVMTSARRSPLAPAYYLGRPASRWIQALDRRPRRSPVQNAATRSAA